MYQYFTLLDHKKIYDIRYDILLHSFTLILIFHYNFVHLYGFHGNILYGKATQLKFLSQI